MPSCTHDCIWLLEIIVVAETGTLVVIEIIRTDRRARHASRCASLGIAGLRIAHVRKSGACAKFLNSRFR